jgi:hypothetical protein
MTIEEYIHHHLEYKDGSLYWKNLVKGSRYNGRVAGVDNGKGYRQIRIAGKHIYAHRVIFFIHHGRWPKEQIDHINKDNTDNRIENLRECSRSQNHMNRKDKPGRDLPRNVYLEPSTNKYRVVLRLNNVPMSFGCYKTVEQAKSVARQAREKYYGEFA